MQVILLERVGKLGAMGEVVKVKNGFARNFLLPQGKALRATDENKARFERERDALEKLNADRRDAAQGKADKLEGASFVLIRQAGESGQLYGSVSARDIAEAANEAGHDVARGQIELPQAIKTIGVYTVNIHLHGEVVVDVQINIARTTEEAERQARGEDVVQATADEDRAIAEAQAVELFEEGAARREEEAAAGASEDE
ncbi:MAG: 50S ribosomal protein L9 [Maricaulaceae bacterium]|jgi:large subunit ribosomal protein L9